MDQAQIRQRLIRSFEHDKFILVVFGYLLLIGTAELITALIVPHATPILFGLVQMQYILMLVLLCLHTSICWETPEKPLLLSLTLVPLIRIISLSLPLASFPVVYWIFIISVPILAAGIIIMKLLNFSWRYMGVNGRFLLWQLPIALSGFVIGYLEYLILKPESLIQSFTWVNYVAAGLILLISTGFMEELLFRRIMQVTAVERFGRTFGIIYIAAIFGVMHIGYNSVPDVLFVFLAGLYLGWVVDKTGSIIGATFAHGIANITLFLIMPVLGFTLDLQPVPLDYGRLLQEGGMWLLLMGGSGYFVRTMRRDPVLIEENL